MWSVEEEHLRVARTSRCFTTLQRLLAPKTALLEHQELLSMLEWFQMNCKLGKLAKLSPQISTLQLEFPELSSMSRE